MPVVSITQQFIRSELVCPPEKKSITFYCSTVGGFAVVVSPTKPGRGLYRLQHKVNGVSTWERIGSTDTMSLDEARAQALTIKAARRMQPEQLKTNETPREMPTLREFFKRDYLPHVKSRKRSWRRDEELFRLRIDAAFGAMKLDAIRLQDVQRFHADLHQSGLAQASADHHVKLLRYALNMAISWGLLDRNVISRFRLYNPDNKVNNVLSREQLDGLIHVLETDRNRTICQVAMLLLSTGARVSEALKAQWSHIDFEQRQWRIPATTAKSKRMRHVPLNDSALMVLRQLSTQGRFDFLFINEQTGKPYTAILKVWERLREKAGVPKLRLHDLRHQFASLLVNSGRTLYDVGTILGHSSPKVTERYAHLSTETLLQAANAASVLKVPRPPQLLRVA
jgi:integrase